MTNVTEMPMPSSEPQGIAEERKKNAKEHFDRIKTAAVVQSRNSLLIGYHAFALKEENLWGILGFGNENDAREAAGVGESTWYSTIRIAEAFKGLPVELFIKMKLLNAMALSDMPESKRLDRDWVQKAADESLKNFKRLVDEELHGKARASDGKERSVKMSIDMPASRKTVIEEKAKVFAEAHGMESADIGKVIEVAMVEATDGDTMINAVLHVVARAKRIKELCESGLSADEVLAQVIVLNEDTILELATVLEVKNGTNEEGSKEAA